MYFDGDIFVLFFRHNISLNDGHENEYYKTYHRVVGFSLLRYIILLVKRMV